MRFYEDVFGLSRIASDDRFCAFNAAGRKEGTEAVVRGDPAKSENVLIEPHCAAEVFHVQRCLQHTYDSRHGAPPWYRQRPAGALATRHGQARGLKIAGETPAVQTSS